MEHSFPAPNASQRSRTQYDIVAASSGRPKLVYTMLEANSGSVAEQVIAYLKRSAGYASSLTVETPIATQSRPWSIIYFITLVDGEGRKKKIAVKVSRFPGQKNDEESWQEPHLIDRGVREYGGLCRIHDFFQAQPNRKLCAVRPIAFVREINGIVMEFIEGESYHRSCLRPGRLFALSGHTRARRLACRVGEWLRAFHDLSGTMQEVPCEPDRLFGPQHALQSVRYSVERLRKRGIDPIDRRIWTSVEARLETLDSDRRVWVHSDFSMSNAMILPEDRVLGLDTGLDKRDHPYADVGKFVAHIQTRAWHTMSFGTVLSTTTIEALRATFLDGYLQGQTLDRHLFALYEGQCLFERWEESLSAIEKKLPHAPAAQRVLAGYGLNPMFKGIIQRWANRIRLSERHAR